MGITWQFINQFRFQSVRYRDTLKRNSIQ